MAARKQTPQQRDPIFKMVTLHNRLSKKLNGLWKRRDEIEALYPSMWFQPAGVVVRMFLQGGGKPKSPVYAYSHEAIDKARKEDWDVFAHPMLGNKHKDPAWVQKFEARWRELHNRLDAAEREQRERRENARHNNVNETYAQLEDEAREVARAARELHDKIVQAVPVTVEGHLFKLAFLIGEHADGLEVEDGEWADVREAMNGLPGISKWKRYEPTAESEGADAS